MRKSSACSLRAATTIHDCDIPGGIPDCRSAENAPIPNRSNMPRAAYRLQTAYRPKQTKSGVTRPFGQNHRQSISKRRARCRYGISFRQRIVRRQNQNRPASLFQQGRRFRQCRFHTVGTHLPMPSARSYPASISTIAPPSHCAPTNRTKSATRYAISTVPTTNRNYAPFPRRARHKLPDCRDGRRQCPKPRRIPNAPPYSNGTPHSGQERQFPPDIGQTVGKIRTFRPLPPLVYRAFCCPKPASRRCRSNRQIIGGIVSFKNLHCAAF